MWQDDQATDEYASTPTFAGCPHCGEPVDVSREINEVLWAFLTALLPRLSPKSKLYKTLEKITILCREEMEYSLDRGFFALSILQRDR